MRSTMPAWCAAAFLFSITSPAFAQSGTSAPPPARTLELSGPRVGITMLSEGVRAALDERGLVVGSTMSQFGWQFERQFYGSPGGLTALHEWVVLVGGVDQGVAIPSLTWLVGVRTHEGAEIGLGPNVTPAGVALAVTAGITFKAGVMNVPMNIAFVPTKHGSRVTLLSGFTVRR